MAPIWLNKKESLQKVIRFTKDAAVQKSKLVVFGEALVPGYPFWLSMTDGAKFNSQIQKEIHSHYLKNGVCIENGDLNELCSTAKENKIAIYLGIIERPLDRGGHSLYCSLVYIDRGGLIKSVHRKLQPTYEERLSWSAGDGNGLITHPLEQFTLGGLNCWENWMPLSRTALYARGENVHIAVWPGEYRNTHDITRFIAKEGRSYVISVSGLFGKAQITDDIPHAALIRSNCPEILANGGSCVAAPDGSWLLEPVIDSEGIFTAELSIDRIYEERQNFDPTGHYSRPDVTKLVINRDRQSILSEK